MAGPIRIAITTDASGAITQLRQVGSSVRQMGEEAHSTGGKLAGFGKTMAASFAGLAGFFAVDKIGEGFKEAIDQAASLQAAIGSTKQIFGSSAGDMLNWSKTAATSLGLSQSEALNATKTFGGFFTAVGMNTKQADTMSKSWATMAGNLAAFGDMPTADAIDAVTGALRGELDPLQKYIPTISAASIQQKAMAMTGKKNAAALTNQDKAAAINAIMMESVANKAGAAERAQGGYAVQMDKLKAQMKDGAAAIGGLFLPMLTKGMTFINNTAIPALKTFGTVVGPKLKSLFGGIGGFKPPKAVIDLATSKQAMSIVTNIKNGFMSLGPVFARVFAVVMPIIRQVATTLGAAFTKALPQIKAILGTIGQIVSQVFELIRVRVTQVVNVIQFIWQNFGANILGYLSSAFAAVITVLQGAFTVIKGIFDVVIGLLTGDWSRAWDGVKTIISGAWQIIRGIFALMQAQVTLVMAVIGKVMSAAWNVIKSAASATWYWILSLIVGAWNGIKAGISAALSFVGGIIAAGWNNAKALTSAIWNGIKAVISTVWNAIKSAVSSAASAVSSAVSAAWNAVRGATSTAWNAVKSAVAAAWSGIRNAVVSGIGNVVALVRGLGGKIRSAVSGAASWLFNTGMDVIRGMINGITRMAGELASKAKHVIQGAIDAAKSVLKPGSPSKVFEALGVMSAQGYALGLADPASASDAAKAIKALIKQVTDALPKTVKRTFPKGTKASVIDAWKKAEAAAAKTRSAKKDALTAYLEKGNAKLNALIDKRDAIGDKLKEANDNIAELQKQRADVVDSVTSTFLDTFKVISDAGDETVASIDDIIQRSRDAVAQSQRFAEQIKSLTLKGVDPRILQELAQAGPKAGLDTATALNSASADQLKELNANYKLIAKSGNAAGNAIASNMYDAGIAAAQKVAAGFASQQAAMERTILTIISNLTETINKAISAITPAPIKAPVVKAPVVKAPTKKPVATPAKPVRALATGRAVPLAAAASVTIPVTVNTGAVVDKRGLVDAISSAFNEVSAQLGRPIAMNVK